MTANKTTTDRVLVEDGRNSKNYGKSYWIADLTGGGYITLYADRPAVNAGCLEFWGRFYPDKDGSPDWDNPRGDEYLLLGLPAGRWSAFYAASVIDGAPVAVDRWIEKGPIK